MNEEISLFKILQRPPLYAPSFPFWNDEHISKGMLSAHLSKDTEGASRHPDFINRSADWIVGVLPDCSGQTLLDLGCGPGLYAEAFCRHGLSVTGVDISARSIAYAEEQVRIFNFPIHYHCCDYLAWQGVQSSFDAAVMIYCDFGVLSDVCRKSLLKKVFGLLKPGGLFIFDVFTLHAYAERKESSFIERYPDGGFWHSSEHICLNSFFRYDSAQTALQHVVILSDEEVKYYYIWEHFFSREELLNDLSEAGFSEVQFFGNVAGIPCGAEDKTLAVIARK